MSYEIKDRYGKTLYVAQGAADVREALQEAVKARANLARANLADANLADAYLADANLADAYLARANLARANLARANLARANLADAYLARANLARANLAGAKGLNPHRTNDLLILTHQVGKIRAFKLVTQSGTNPFHARKRLKYVVGKTLEVKDADCDPTKDCGAGINVATLPWVLRNHITGYRVFVVEFTSRDIACIPHASDGKFRLHRCKVVKELNLDEVFALDAKPEEKQADKQEVKA